MMERESDFYQHKVWKKSTVFDNVNGLKVLC